MGSIPVANPSPPRRWHLSRRFVAVSAFLLALSATFAVVLLVMWPGGTTDDRDNWVGVGSPEAIPVEDPVRFPDHRFWLVRLESGEFLALSQVDPRSGCTVPWNPAANVRGQRGLFRDPCHGAAYDITGACLLGPCARDMDRFPVRIESGQVQVSVP
jgi:nitrite reductase/ring-hydroxylating ferredoxin subunit